MTTELSKKTGLSVGNDVLIKTRQTRPQKELVNITQKTLNIKGAFKVQNYEKIGGKKVLLINDLFDSGATMNDCTRMLKSAGARKVFILILPRTMHVQNCESKYHFVLFFIRRKNMEPQDLKHWLALPSVAGIGAATYQKLLDKFGSPKEVFAAKRI